MSIVTPTVRKTVLLLLGLLPFALIVWTLLFRPDLFPLALAAATVFTCLWILGRVAASVVYRKRAGKYIFTPRRPDALFSERWISGRGHKPFLFGRSGTSNCLWLTVTADRLLVGLIFPYNLLFFPERLGLEYDLPASDIVEVTLKPRRFGRPIATVRFRSDDGTAQELELMLRDTEGFINAVRSLTE
jgi:hypothetical protein